MADRRDVLTRTVRAVVRGRVQGVGYRAFAEREARARGLAGWVRNRRDGSVETVLAGEAAAVNGMLAALRRGPPGAVVSDVEASPHAGPVTDGFDVLPTA